MKLDNNMLFSTTTKMTGTISGKQMKVWIIDDHQLFSSGLAGLLEDHCTDVVIDLFPNVDDIASAADTPPPDVILLDFYMPGRRGGDAVRFLHDRYPDAEIIIISASHSLEDRREADNAGAAAFLSKSSEPDKVIEAVIAAARGDDVKMPVQPAAPTSDLTDRQLAVLDQIRRGASNRLAATELGMSPETVKSHLSEAFRRLGVSTRTEAVDVAVRRGLL